MTRDECLFCRIVAGEVTAHIVLDEPDVIGFLDHRPVFKGHVLVVPREHVVTLPELPTPLLTAVFVAVQRCARAVVEGLGAQGSWIAQNNIVSQAVPRRFRSRTEPAMVGNQNSVPRRMYTDIAACGRPSARVQPTTAKARRSRYEASCVALSRRSGG